MNKLVYIDSFERDTISILEHLMMLSSSGNKGQEVINKKYIKEHESQLADTLKKNALMNVFVASKVMLIYGTAGTGKTTLINYISILFGRNQLQMVALHY